MTVDISRKSYDPRRHTAYTTTMQGRVTTDAPINENQAQRDRRARAMLVDLAGRCGYPAILPDSFKIGISGGKLTIAPGRYYVDGQPAENFGTGLQAFDPVLSELRGLDPVKYADQPFGDGSVNGPVATPANGTHVVYIDVWQRDVTFLEDDTILDPAIATDTFARCQTVWQVRTFPTQAGATCSTQPVGWDAFTSPSRARLSTRANPANAITDPCLLPPGALYRGIDNRTYLVAIHGFMANGTPLIKFSRTNGTVATAILAQPQGDVIEVAQVAKDDFLRFNAGDWVEISDEPRLLAGQSGTMARILSVDDASNSITLEDPLPAGALTLVGSGPNADQARHPVLRRWDQSGEIRDANGVVLVDLDAPGATGLIPAPTDGTFVVLEDGVEAALTLATGIGTAHVNDNWSFIARYADTSVEELQVAAPHNYHHHFCRLAVVTASGGQFTVVHDCRVPLDNDDDCCCVSVEPGQSIQAAIDSLPTEVGGCICLVAGLHQIDTELVLTTSNVHIVGESRGAIVERTTEGTVLRIEDAYNIDIDMVTFRHPDSRQAGGPASGVGGNAGAILEILDCDSVNIARCDLAATKGTISTGILVNGLGDITIRDCDFGAMAFGVVSTGGDGALAIVDSRFDLHGEDVVGLIAIAASNCKSVIKVAGNHIQGVINGIVINDDPASKVRHSLAAGSLVADNTVRLTLVKQESDDWVQRAIDTAADRCVVRGNQIELAGDPCIGILASGEDLTITENHIDVEGDMQGGASLGIVIGSTDDEPKFDSLTQAVNVTLNSVRGTTVGIFARHASDVTIADNHLHEGWEGKPLLMPLLLGDMIGTEVRGNSVGPSTIALFSVGGRHTSVVGNRFAASNIGVTLLGEFAATVEGNAIDLARSFGVAIGWSSGRTVITGNRLHKCGHGSAFAGGIGAVLVLGELVVSGNEIAECGRGPDTNVNPAPVTGILGLFILEALVSDNLVSYAFGVDSNSVRPDGLEDRALAILGLLGSPQGDDTPTFGFPCAITNNKFYGKGFTALVELLKISSSDDGGTTRFDRIFFTNNYCLHFGKTDMKGATVRLVGNAAVVMGNQIKGPGREFPSIDLTGMKGTVVGNITSGAIINEPNFPATVFTFNQILA